MKCHERWIDLLASVEKAYPQLAASVAQHAQICKLQVEQAQLDFAFIERALAELYLLSHDPGFGWKVGWNISLRTQLYKAAMIYIDSQPTMGDALAATMRYPELVVLPGMEYVPEMTSTQMWLHVRPTRPFRYFDQMAAMCLSGVLRATRDRVTDFDVSELLLDGELPEKFFSTYTSAKVKHGAGQFSMAASLAWMQHPQPTADSTLAGALKPILDAEVGKLRRQGSLVDRIEQALNASEQPLRFSLKEFASESGQSEAGIRRKLSETGLNFSELVDSYLRTLTIRYLIDERETVDSVCLRLGFSERPAFERAFRRWYGLSPAQFREKYSAMRELGTATHSSLAEVTLAALPKVVQQALQLIESEHCSVTALANVIKTDLVFSARLMSAASSAFYSAGRIRDLNDAIGRVLGTTRVRNLALTLAVSQIAGTVPGVDLQRIWYTSLFVEHWLGNVGGQLDWPFEVPFHEFATAVQFGLVGHLLIAQSELPEKQMWLEKANSSTLHELVKWEKAQLGMTAFTMSSLLLMRWGMSAPVCRFLLTVGPAEADTSALPGLGQAALFISDMALASYRQLVVDANDWQVLTTALQAAPDVLKDSYAAACAHRSEINGLLQQLR